MKINGHNIISTDDVFISSAKELGNSLTSVLEKHEDSILKLKGDVKWIYKYGGVGGSGTGSSISKLKILAVIYYTDTSGQELFTQLRGGENISIKENTEFSVITTITSTKSLNEYKYSIGEQSTIIKATDTNGKITIKPSSNKLYTLIVNGETTVSFDFNVYVKVMDKSLTLYDSNGYAVNGVFFTNDIPKLEFKLTNYIPDLYKNWNIDYLYINGISIDENDFIVSDTKEGNASCKTLNVNLKRYFSESTAFGIYNFTVHYTFDNIEYTESDIFLYKKKDEIFILCYTKNDVVLYENDVEIPQQTNKRTISIYYKIHGVSQSSADTKYNLFINGVNIGLVKIDEEHSYFIDNKVENDERFAINFSTDNYTKTYYVYLLKPDPLKYFFLNSDLKNYNGAVYSNTDMLNDSVITLPDRNPISGKYQFTLDATYKLKKVASTFGGKLASELHTLQLNEFISNQMFDSQNPAVDGLFSFAIQYKDNNYDKPIITVSNNGADICVYKNKITYTELNTTPTEDKTFFIPEECFLLMYFKCDYLIDIDNKTFKKPTVIFLVDGIYETKPLTISEFGSLSTNTTITYHTGNWSFDHLGFATFNCGPSGNVSINNYPKQILKYYHDFDPIIPVNYYQTYVSSIENKNDFLKWLGDKQIDALIYELLSVNNYWINYYKSLLKFISINPSILVNLTNLPAYEIIPNLDKNNDTIDFNSFFKNTITSYEENQTTPETTASFLKWDGNNFKLLIEGYNYKLKYLGSSTLLYGVKNFEISTVKHLDGDDNWTQMYFTPDINKFNVETSFNLKADMVDSSHSTNVIIGNFVNDYMQAPFRKNESDTATKACLTGYPCLLFMKNNNASENSEKDHIFLGIYNMNLNRSSVVNLGYVDLPENIELESGQFEEVKYWNESSTAPVKNRSNYRIAEVLDNSSLYDYSLYDRGVLQTMLGDFYNAKSDAGYDTEYSTDFETIFKHVNSLVGKLLKLDSTSDKYVFPIFDGSSLSYITQDGSDESYYYYNDDGILTEIDKSERFITLLTINNDFKNYRDLQSIKGAGGTLKKLSKITNPKEQYHLVYNSKGEPYLYDNNLCYYRTLSNVLMSDDLVYNHQFDLDNLLRYYIVCMAFGMVDSVLKNLTIKCPEFNANTSRWYLGFYDMDTAFGINNSGGRINFKAFSDFVTDDLIISDYMSPGTEGWFDSPSSYLFLLAKYKERLTNPNSLATPYHYWLNLRNGALRDADTFYSTYINNYFGNIHPLIWNLNFMYKYFGVNASTNNTDTELLRFNGTLKHYRKYWLDLRINFLDPLFGIKYNRYIGTTNTDITGGHDSSIGSINETMFEQFNKGSVGNIPSVTLTGEPNSLVILQLSTTLKYIYIFNQLGIINTKAVSVTSNTNAGFYGTKTIKSISDCGPFLNNISNGVINTIKNNYITSINILSGIENAKTALTYSNTNSVKDIIIKNTKKDSTYTIDWYDYEKLDKNVLNTITVGSDVSTDDTVINLLVISNLKCKTCTIKNSKITTLKFDNCDIENLVFQNVNISNYILNNFNVESMNVIGLANTYTAENSKIGKLQITTSLSELSLKNCDITSITFNNTQYLNTLDVDLKNCKEFLVGVIDANNLIRNTSLLTAILKFNCVNHEEVKFRLSGFNNLKTLNIVSVNSIKLLLQLYAFLNDSALEQLSKNNITYIILGNNVFNNCYALDSESLTCYSEIRTSDISSMYTGNHLHINDDFVNNWCDSWKDYSVKFTNLSKLFYHNYNVSDLDTFENNLCALLNNHKPANISEVLRYTNVKKLSTKLAKSIAICTNKVLPNFVGYSSGNFIHGFNGYLTIEESALQEFDNILLASGLCTFYNNQGLVFNVKISNILNLNITSINGLNIQMNESINLDFEEGLPSKITTLKNFMVGSLYWNVTNFENCFNKCGNNLINTGRCFTLGLTYWSSFETELLGYNIPYDKLERYTDKYKQEINLYQLLFNSDSSLKLKASSLQGILTGGTWSFTFPKNITENQFVSLMLYLQDNKVYNIPYLFSNCFIDSSDKNLFKNKLINFTNLSYTFYNFGNSWCYFDLDGAFIKLYTEGELIINEDAFSCKNLSNTFARTNLYKLTKPLTNKISVCDSMYRTFASCKWKYEENTNLDAVKVIGDLYLQCPKFIPKIVCEKNLITQEWEYSEDMKYFQIIPDNFFKCVSGNNYIECFWNLNSHSENLFGYIPYNCDIELYKADGIINNCFILYQSIKDADTVYLIYFPDTYVDNNQSQRRLTMYLVLPPVGDVVYIFDLIDRINYLLAGFPKASAATINVGNNWLNSVGFVNVYTSPNELKCIKASRYYDSDNLLPETTLSSKTRYKSVIPYSILGFLNISSDIFYDFNDTDKEYGMPIAYNDFSPVSAEAFQNTFKNLETHLLRLNKYLF